MRFRELMNEASQLGPIEQERYNINEIIEKKLKPKLHEDLANINNIKISLQNIVKIGIDNYTKNKIKGYIRKLVSYTEDISTLIYILTEIDNSLRERDIKYQ